MSAYLLGAVVILVLLYAMAVYNRLVRQRALAREGWSGIDVQLRRRADLVPNLVQTVQGYASHERGVFEEVAASRTRSVAAKAVGEQAQAERQLEGALGRLFALAEAYPELEADANFRQLQTQLGEIEDQLQMARRYYNGAVRDLNIQVQSFPANLLAAPLGFKEEPFFELGDEAARAAPQVSFAR